jgi:hypothetical protein
VSASQPAFHFVEDVTGEVFTCTSTSYTITSGSIRFTIHEGQSKTGNLNFTGTITPVDVVAEDPAGNEVAIRGADWFGGTANASRETEQFWNTEKFQIIDQGGGTIDSVKRYVLHPVRQRRADQREGLRLRDLRGTRGRGVSAADHGSAATSLFDTGRK